jgi:HAMP domain-containing protein
MFMNLKVDPRRWSLATKWSLMLTALALVPLWGVIRYSDQTATSRILQKSVAALADGAADSAASMDAALSERVRQAQYLGSLPSVRDFLAVPPAARAPRLALLQADLKATLAAYPYLESIDLLETDGTVLFSTSGLSGSLKETDLVKAATGGKPYVAGLKTEKAQTQPSLVIAAPIGAGMPSGVLRLQSSPEFLTQRVKKDDQRQTTTSLGLLLDEQGKVITRSDSAAPWEVIHQEQDGRLRTQYGDIYYTERSALQTVPWTYMLGMPEDLIANEVADQRARSILLAIGCSLVLGGLARLMALRITRPLLQLAQASRALAAGDLTFSLTRSSQKDEMGDLQAAFAEAYMQLRRLVARMRLSSHLVAEASEHLHTMTGQQDRISETMTTASQKLSVVSRDLERQVAHFRI